MIIHVCDSSYKNKSKAFINPKRTAPNKSAKNAMMNRFLNNKTFTPFPHGARGRTFLSRFILYPLRATSPTRGTLGAIGECFFVLR